MAAQVTDEMEEVMQLLESEPSGSPDSKPLVQTDISFMRELLAILVCTGKAKQAIGVHLTHEQMKRFTDKEVEKHYKRYEAHVGAKTTETLTESFLKFAINALGIVVQVKNAEALQNELQNDYIITNELSDQAGSLALKCGRMLAVINVALIRTKHIDFSPPHLLIEAPPPLLVETAEVPSLAIPEVPSSTTAE